MAERAVPRCARAWSRRAWATGLGLCLAGGCAPEANELALVGTVERTLVEVIAPVSEKLVAIEVQRGEPVSEGQVLARLDPAFALADLASAEAIVAGARTASAIRGQDWRRAANLHRDRVISAQELDRARLAHDQADAELRAAEARLSAARRLVDDHVLVAPVAGVVDQIPFDRGERVPAGAVVVVLLEDSPPWVRVWLPERAVATVGPGTPAVIRVSGFARPLSGRVIDVAREPEFTPHYALTERERGHLVYESRVRIEDAPAQLRPGTAADVAIALGSPTDGGPP